MLSATAPRRAATLLMEVTRPHLYESDVNATFAELAAHYNVDIIPASSYRPAKRPRPSRVP